MPVAVEDDVLVDLVGDREQVVRPAQSGDERQLVPAEHFAGRVLRRVDDNRLDRRVGGGRGQLVAVDPPGPRAAVFAQRHEPGREPEDRGLRRVELVAGLHHHDAVARLEEGAERRRHAFGGPEHDGDLVLGVRPPSVEPVGVVGDGAPQLGQAERERVLVVLIARSPHAGQQLLHREVEDVAAPAGAVRQQVAHGHRFEPRDPFLRPGEHRRDSAPHQVVHRRLVREPLRQVHRAVLDGEPGHPPNQGLVDGHAASLPGNSAWARVAAALGSVVSGGVSGEGVEHRRPASSRDLTWASVSSDSSPSRAAISWRRSRKPVTAARTSCRLGPLGGTLRVTGRSGWVTTISSPGRAACLETGAGGSIRRCGRKCGRVR